MLITVWNNVEQECDLKRSGRRNEFLLQLSWLSPISLSLFNPVLNQRPPSFPSVLYYSFSIRSVNSSHLAYENKWFVCIYFVKRELLMQTLLRRDFQSCFSPRCLLYMALGFKWVMSICAWKSNLHLHDTSVSIGKTWFIPLFGLILKCIM